MPKDTSSAIVFSEAKVHDLVSLNKIQTAICMHKYNNKLLPKSFDNMFVTNEDYHHYNTRISSLYHVPMRRLTRTKLSLNYRGVIVWNSISQDIRTSNTLQGFKKAIKNEFT